MSTGNFHLASTNGSSKELHSLLSSGRIFSWVYDRKYRTDRTFDIPYIGGCSKSGDVIYVDRDLPLVVDIVGTPVPVLQYITLHERFEKALTLLMRMEYEEAHKAASLVVKRELQRRNILYRDYNQALDPFIKASDLVKVKRVPKDLDFKPYSDSGDIQLIQHMKRRRA